VKSQNRIKTEMSFKDYKTPKDRLSKSGTNDWIMLPAIIFVGIVWATVLMVHIVGIDGLADVVMWVR